MSEGIRIKDMPASERPRERLADSGPEALRSAELIAILLRTGLRGVSAINIGDALITKYGTLSALERVSLDQLQEIPGIGRDKAVTLKAAFTLARRMAAEMHGDTPLLDTPEKIADLLREEVRGYEVEHFHAILLNVRRKLIRIERISKGLVDSLLVHPREVFKSAISANASALVLVHNHPSGDPTPSEADIRATRDLIRAGQLLKIEVLDHVIIGRRANSDGKDYVSLRELGFFHA